MKRFYTPSYGYYVTNTEETLLLSGILLYGLSAALCQSQSIEYQVYL